MTVLVLHIILEYKGGPIEFVRNIPSRYEHQNVPWLDSILGGEVRHVTSQPISLRVYRIHWTIRMRPSTFRDDGSCFGVAEPGWRLAKECPDHRRRKPVNLPFQVRSSRRHP